MKAIAIGVCICMLGCDAPSANDTQLNENHDIESSYNLSQGKKASRGENEDRNDSMVSDSLACMDFLKQFYTSYLGACLDDLEEAAKLRDSLIEAGCTESFKEFFKTIDWDAILAAQDCTIYSANHFTVQDINSSAGIYLIEYSFYGGDPSNTEEIVSTAINVEVIIQLVEISGELKINQAVSSVEELM